MYERKKRDSVRAGSASYVSRRHFSTICQSLPFFFSPLFVLSGFNLHSVTPRAPSLAGCLRWAQFVAGKNGKRDERARSCPLGANPYGAQPGCERQNKDVWNVEERECNISEDDVYFIKEMWIFLLRRCTGSWKLAHIFYALMAITSFPCR